MTLSIRFLQINFGYKNIGKFPNPFKIFYTFANLKSN